MELRSTHHRMLRRLLFTTVLIGLSFTNIWAQSRTVTGKVTASEDGSAIPGVNVVLKGTNKGTSSNASGIYSIALTEANPVLIFSFVGYDAIEVPVGTRSVVDVADSKYFNTK